VNLPVAVAGGAIALALLAAPAAPAAAQGQSSYPTRPIRIVATTTPGSGPDIIARLVGQKLTEAWGQQTVVDTRPGASGIIGTEIVARAAPDGYTLMICTSQHAIVAGLYPKLPWDLARDFAPAILIGTAPFILAAHPGEQAKSVKELVELARAKPGQLRYGSGGSGSPPHLSMEILKSMTGIEIQHVPYKGVTPALIDTMAGEVQMMFAVIPAVLPMVKGGKLRALGVSTARRSPLLPELPTVAESVPGYEYIGWYSLVAPAGTPAPILARLNAEIGRALKTAEMQERISGLGAEALGSTREELAVFIREQMAKMRAAIKASGAKPDQ